MNIHVRYKELRSVGEYENAEAEASISIELEMPQPDPKRVGSPLSWDTEKIAQQKLEMIEKLVFNSVQQQIQAARRVHGLKIGDEVIGTDKYERHIKVWTVEEITNKYIYCLRMIDDWMDEEKKPVAERRVFSHSEVEKATLKLKELAGLE